MKISIDAFTGMVPKLAPTMLPNSAAQVASNVKLISGSLKPVNSPAQESLNIIASATSVYMLGAAGAQVPLSWVADVDVAASPLADSEYRIYYTGDSVPKKTSALLAGAPTGGPTSWYHMGMPAPASAATATPSTASGSVPAGTYVYVYTYVTQFGATLLEESAPSPAVTATLGATGNIALTLLANPPAFVNYNYQYKRIYRTTGTAFQLVAQIAHGTTNYTDSLGPTAILGDALATTGWLPPPSTLKGITTLPSSVLVGFTGNEIWFSEPGFPHAWPAAYMQSFDSQIVGIKSYGNNVVVATQSYPSVGGGVHPDSFTFQKLPMLEPCLSKRGMASDEFGVLYPSSNGLVAIGMDANGLASANFVSRDAFASYAPDTFTACVFERRYYGFYTSATYGNGAFVYTRADQAPVSTLSLSAKAVTVDAKTARMLFVDATDGKLYRYDPPDTLAFTYTWKSKLFQLPTPTNLGCFRITGPEDSASDLAFVASVNGLNALISAANTSAFAAALGTRGGLNEAEINASAANNTFPNMSVLGLNGSILQGLIPLAAPEVNATVWQGKAQVLTGSFRLNTMYRLPSGTRALGYEVAITGQREVYGIQLATSPQELMNG